jgi:4-amino-4-deoxy-L-arabinose transferase-like glycosyltransferase
MAWLAWRLYGAETARWLLLLLPTTVGMIGFSHAAATDMPFSGMLTVAMVCAAVVLRLTPDNAGASAFVPAATEPSRLPSKPSQQSGAPHTSMPSASAAPAASTPWLALVLFGFFLGLAVLAKGPAGIVLCGGAVFFWAAFTKRWRDALRLLHPAALAAFCVTALPWYILCARRNPDFFRVFIIEHNFKRYLTPEFQHIQPFWYYAPIFLLAVLPWAAILLWQLGTAVARLLRSNYRSPNALFFSGWIVFCLLFFSASQSKLPGYILPAIPPAGLVLSRGFLLVTPENRRVFGAITLVIGLALFVFAEFVGAIRIHAVRDSAQVLFALLGVLLALAVPNILLALGFLVSKNRGFQNGCLCAAVVALAVSMFLADRVLRDLQPIYWRQKDLALQLKGHRVPLDRVFVYLAVDRSTRFAINFYLHRDIPDWNEDANADAYLISGHIDCERFRKSGFACEGVPLGSPAEGFSVSHIIPGASASRSPTGSGQAQ